MDNENYTTEVQKSLAEAQKVAINRKHQEIGINELFKVLVQPGEIAAEIYKKAGLDIQAFESFIDGELDKVSVVVWTINKSATFFITTKSTRNS